MIKLKDITISDNMYLGGIVSGKQVETNVIRLLSGAAVVQGKAISGGRPLTLGSTKGRATQGFWCQTTVDAIKALEALNQPVELDYHGTVYNVLISDTSSLVQFDPRVPVSPTKTYTGQINLIEV